MSIFILFFFFSSRRRHTRCLSDWSSDVCSSDLAAPANQGEKRKSPTAGAKKDLDKLQGTWLVVRSEERRVGKECRSRWWQYHENKKISEQCKQAHEQETSSCKQRWQEV